MASSMLTGKRRWASSSRRGGMTVLGKVSVPKPVNLPSQRLENHGVDPNVEIVPKGTLSWGSQTSSSAPNAWGSTAFSPPSTDGIAGSPSRLNGRPSSGGSGTRPSTAGSDRSHEPAPNAWGSNSRPSSASGLLASNQASMVATRPRSAETRPGSSQLSRFADPVSENSVAWGAQGTAEKLGAPSSKDYGFTLSSGDFPTLGSEKNVESHGRQGHSSHGRPVSASGRVATPKDDSGTSPTESESVDLKAGRATVNTWNTDGSSYVGDGAPPSMEKWERDPQPYLNPGMPPQHLDPWHGTPVRNASDGVWYRGPPGCPPYGTPGPPGSFPLEPFAYYHPQVSARALANSQPGPRPGAGPSAYHPKSGDSYRPQMPDSYIQPVLPVRPGVYPGMLPYDGYYGPPRIGYCNSNERDSPVIGMATGPCVYNRYANHMILPESGNQVRPSGYPSPSMTNEQVEPGQDGHQGPYKVLLKQHDGWEEKDVEKMGHNVISSAPHGDRRKEPASIIMENDQRTDHGKEEVVGLPKTVFGGFSSQSADGHGGCSLVTYNQGGAYAEATDNRGSSPVPVVPGQMNNARSVDDSLLKKPETAAVQEQSQLVFLATRRNPTLIDKIECLNSKARISDGGYDGGPKSSRDDKTRRFRVANAKADCSTNQAGMHVVSAERTSSDSTRTTSSNDGGSSAVPSGAVMSMSVGEQVSIGTMMNSSVVGEREVNSQMSKRVNGVQGRADYRGKGRFSSQEGEEWRKKPPVGGVSTTSVPVPSKEPCPDVHVQGIGASQEALEKHGSNFQGKVGTEYGTPAFDPSDYNAQRAKMKELATQRAKQLQKEEEERIREQKAKALAKLEELNRRTQVGDSLNKKLDHSSSLSGAIQHGEEESSTHSLPTSDTGSSREAPLSASGKNSNAAAQLNENERKKLGQSTDISKNISPEFQKSVSQDVVSHDLALPMQLDADSSEATDLKSAAQIHDSSVSRHKQMVHKKKQNITLENTSEKLAATGTNADPVSQANLSTNALTMGSDPSLSSGSNTVDDPLPQQKKRNNRSSKSKHKLDEPVSGYSPSLVPIERYPAKVSVESDKSKAHEADSEIQTVHASNLSTTTEYSLDAIPSTNIGWSLPTEEAHSRHNNQWKPQPPRRMSRNPQATRSADKFHTGEAVWAPVRSQNRNDFSEEANQSTTVETNTPSAKNDHGMQNTVMKNKRAEIERYVPKPVVKDKEQSQQGNFPPPLSPSISQATSSETSGRAESGSQSAGPDGSILGKSGFSVDSKNGDSKPHKHGKAHGAWRQRGSTEQTSIQSSQDGSLPSKLGKTVQTRNEQHQPLKTEVHPLEGQTKHNDSWCAPVNPVSAELVTGTAMKDHHGTSRGKRNPFKGHKGVSPNQNPVDHKDSHIGTTGKVDNLSLNNELSQQEGRITSRENHGVGEHPTSHWQPKSQTYLAHNRQGSKASGDQKVAAQASGGEMEFSPHGGKHLPSQSDKGKSVAMVQAHPHRSDTQKINLGDAPSIRRQEIKRERRGIDTSKEGALPPSRGLVTPDEQAPKDADAQHDQSFSSSGLPRHGQHNSRTGRAQESQGGWSLEGQDNSKQYHLPANGDRRRYNSHYEYQPIGTHSNKSGYSPEGTTDGSRITGSRYRDRGQNHSRRGGGNFYGRNNSAVKVSTGGGNGE